MDDTKIARCAVELRSESDLGRTQHGGLSGIHHFCFATYQRPDRLDWGRLRAVHHYQLQAGKSREPTFHAGFEIVTLVTGGSLRRTGSHEPSEPLSPESMEIISTGLGANLGLTAQGDEPGCYIEIWVKSGSARRRSRRQYDPRAVSDLAKPIVSNGSAGSTLTVWQSDAELFRVKLAAGERMDVIVEENQRAYLVIVTGEICGNGIVARAQEGLAIVGPGLLTLRATQEGEWLMVRDPGSVALSTRAPH